MAGTSACSWTNCVSGKGTDRRQWIFMDDGTLAVRTHLFRAAKIANQEFEFILVLFAHVLKDEADSDGMMRSFDLGAAAHHGLAHTQQEKKFRANRESGDCFNIAAVQAHVT